MFVVSSILLCLLRFLILLWVGARLEHGALQVVERWSCYAGGQRSHNGLLAIAMAPNMQSRHLNKQKTSMQARQLKDCARWNYIQLASSGFNFCLYGICWFLNYLCISCIFYVRCSQKCSPRTIWQNLLTCWKLDFSIYRICHSNKWFLSF